MGNESQLLQSPPHPCATIAPLTPDPPVRHVEQRSPSHQMEQRSSTPDLHTTSQQNLITPKRKESIEQIDA